MLVLWGYTFNESHYFLLEQNELLFKSDSSDYLAHTVTCISIQQKDYSQSSLVTHEMFHY